MREFGWTIEYTLSLSFPVFLDLFGLIRRVRADAAIDGVYMPYAAAKYGGKISKQLFDLRGSQWLTGKTSSTRPQQCSCRDTELAMQKLQAIIDARSAALIKAATQC